MLRALSRDQLSFHVVIGECAKGPQPNATTESLAQTGSTESLAHTGPPLSDLSRCSPTIVAPLATPNPNTAMADQFGSPWRYNWWHRKLLIKAKYDNEQAMEMWFRCCEDAREDDGAEEDDGELVLFPSEHPEEEYDGELVSFPDEHAEEEDDGELVSFPDEHAEEEDDGELVSFPDEHAEEEDDGELVSFPDEHADEQLPDEHADEQLPDEHADEHADEQLQLPEEHADEHADEQLPDEHAELPSVPYFIVTVRIKCACSLVPHFSVVGESFEC
jgi:hypothetical protein